MGIMFGRRYRLEFLCAEIIVKRIDKEKGHFISDYYYSDYKGIVRNGRDTYECIKTHAKLI